MRFFVALVAMEKCDYLLRDREELVKLAAGHISHRSPDVCKKTEKFGLFFKQTARHTPPRESPGAPDPATFN
jgi:hypothetical protein